LIEAAAPFRDHKPFLVLTTDLYLGFVLENYEMLKIQFLFEINPHQVIKEFLEKDNFSRLAAEIGFKIPLSVDVAKDDDVGAIAQTLPFPVIVKPPYRNTQWYSKYPWQKAFVAANANEFE
jgi:predicted ATP-grasp superfamily ATP-dependent carboligase